MDVDLFRVSEQITNWDKPAYLSQFEPQKFDAVGNPAASNDTHRSLDKFRLADLERELSYQGGWTSIDPVAKNMTYGVVPESKFDMPKTAFFNRRGGYGTDHQRISALAQRKTEVMTGNDPAWRSKTECSKLFDAKIARHDVAEMPDVAEVARDRIPKSRYYQAATPIKSQKVTPGLGLDYHETARHGLHDTYRCPIKTVDELRVKPKITYRDRIIHGMHGTMRPIKTPIAKNRPETFRTNQVEDLLPSRAQITGPVVRQKIVMRPTHKASLLHEYTGAAYVAADAVQANVPTEMRSKRQASRRQTFRNPKPMQKYAHDQTRALLDAQPYQMTPTLRQTLDVDQDWSAADGATHQGAMCHATVPTRSAMSTLIAESAPPVMAPDKSNTMYGVVHNMDDLRATQRGGADTMRVAGTQAGGGNMIYHHEAVAPTLRETSIQNVRPQNAITGEVATAPHLATPLNTTLRDIAINNSTHYAPNLMPNVQGQVRPSVLPTNLREVLTTIPHHTWTQPGLTHGTVHFSDDLAPTQRGETFTSYGPVVAGSKTPRHYDAILPQTLRDITHNQYPTSMVGGTVSAQTPRQDTATPSTTLRETVQWQPQLQLQVVPHTTASPTRNIASLPETTIREINLIPDINHRPDMPFTGTGQVRPQAPNTTQQETRRTPTHTWTSHANASALRPQAPNVTQQETRRTPIHTWTSHANASALRPQAPDATQQDTRRTPTHTWTSAENASMLRPLAPDVTLQDTRRTPTHTWISSENASMLRPPAPDVTQQEIRTNNSPNRSAINGLVAAGVVSDRAAPETTMREILSQTPSSNMRITRGDRQAGVLHVPQPEMTTLREISTHNSRMGSTSDHNKMAIRPTDSLSTNMRETTQNSDAVLGMQTQTQGHAVHQIQPMATTLREIPQINRRNQTPYTQADTLFLSNGQAYVPNPTHRDALSQSEWRAAAHNGNMPMMRNSTVVDTKSTQRSTPIDKLPIAQGVGVSAARLQLVPDLPITMRGQSITHIAAAAPAVNKAQPVRHHSGLAATQRELSVINQHGGHIMANQSTASPLRSEKVMLSAPTLRETTQILQNGLAAAAMPGLAPQLQPNQVPASTLKDIAVQTPHHHSVCAQPTLAPRITNGYDLATTTRELSSGQNRRLHNIQSASAPAASLAQKPDLPTTLRDKTVSNHHIKPAYSVRNGAYHISDVDLPATIRESYLQNQYLPAPVGHERERLRIDADNMRLNEKLESVQIYRSPTQSATNLGPEDSMTEYRLRERVNTNANPMPGYTAHPQGARLETITRLKSEDSTNHRLFIDDAIIAQLSQNPYCL